MSVIRQRLQKRLFNPIEALDDTTRAMNAFMAAQMHPVPIVFVTRARLRANLSVDHNLSLPDKVTTGSSADANVGHPLRTVFTGYVSSFASLVDEQFLSLTATTTASLTPVLVQEHTLTLPFVTRTATHAELTTAVALDSLLSISTSYNADLRQENPLVYQTVTQSQTSLWLGQDIRLCRHFKHLSIFAAPLTHEQSLSSYFSVRDTASYELGPSFNLTSIFSHTASLQAGLESAHPLRARYGFISTLKTNLGTEHGLIKKSITTARLQANLTVLQNLSYKGTTTARLSVGFKVDAAFAFRFRINRQFTVNISQLHALSARYGSKARFAVPLRTAIPLRQVFSHTMRLTAPLQTAAPLKITLSIRTQLRANPVQISFLRARIVVVLGIFARLTQEQPTRVKITGRQIVRLPVVQGQPCQMIAVHPRRFQVKLLQSHPLQSAYKHTALLPANLFALYEPETYVLLARMNPVPNYAQRVAINNYVKALKNGGLWALMDYLYIFAAANTANANLNWVSSTKYQAVPQNGPSFTAWKGYTFGGLLVASSLDTGLNPAARTSLFSQNSAHLYVRTLSNIAVLNAQDTGNSNSFINSKAALNLASVALNSAASLNLSTTDAGAGPFAVNRNNANNFDGYSKNAGPMTMTSPSTTPANANLTIGGGLSVISSRQIAAAAAGSAMTTAQMQAFISQTETLLSALGAI